MAFNNNNPFQEVPRALIITYCQQGNRLTFKKTIYFKICTVLKYICFLMQGNCAFLLLNFFESKTLFHVPCIAEDIHTQLSSKVILGKSYAYWQSTVSSEFTLNERGKHARFTVFLLDVYFH